MAIKHATVTVGTSAVDLTSGVVDSGGNSIRSVVLTNAGAASVYLGGLTVTTAAFGYELKAGAELAIDLGSGDVPFGIAAAAGGSVRVLHMGV